MVLSRGLFRKGGRVVQAVLLVVGLSSQFGRAAAVPHSVSLAPTRILVKVRAPLALQFEKEFQAQPSGLVPSGTRSQTVGTFLKTFGTRKVSPLFPGLLRQRAITGATDAQMAAQVRKAFAQRAARVAVAKVPEISRTYVLELQDSSAENLDAVLLRLKADARVEFAEADRVVSICAGLPDDPYLSSTGTWGQSYQDLWGLYAISAPTAWSTSMGDGVVVAVVDTGVDRTHPDIAANIWTNAGEIAGNSLDDDGNGYVDDTAGWDFIGANYLDPVQGPDPTDHFGHGTHVAGIIAAAGNNGIGIIGVAPHARIMALKALDNNGNGNNSILAEAIIYAANNGADVINASWGLLATPCPQVLEDAIQYAYSLGVVFVAAAGNDGIDAAEFAPANAPEAIVVGSVYWPGGLSFFSNFGSKLDVAAPGEDILSLRATGTSMGTPLDDNYTRASGTSMATPHVSGLAALILSHHPGWAIENLRQALRSSARRTDMYAIGWTPLWGDGTIDAVGALASAETSVVQARILSPLAGTVLAAAVPVKGIVQGTALRTWVLECGEGVLPQAWNVLGSGSASVTGGTLATLDPGSLEDGVHTLRLTAHDASGTAYCDRLTFQVRKLVLSSPAPFVDPTLSTEFKPGAVIPILGSVLDSSGQGFRILWAKGSSPTTGWSDTGITLATGDTTASGALLGQWDTSSVTVADFYTIRLQVDSGAYSNHADTRVYLEPDLAGAQWPYLLESTPSSYSGLVPLVDGGGQTLLALVMSLSDFQSSHGAFLRFSPDGGLLGSTVLGAGGYFNPPVMAGTGTSGQVLLAPNNNTDISTLGTDGSVTLFHQGRTANPLDGMQGSFMLLADVEGTGAQDLVTVSTNFHGGDASLLVLRPDNTFISSKFPLSIPDANATLCYTPRVLVGDIDGDGANELVVVTGTSEITFSLALFKHDGTPVPWPIPEFHGTPAGVVLADLDRNGKLETVVTEWGSEKVHVFQPDGTERPGWPRIGCGPVTVGDLERNGTCKIVVNGSDRLWVWNPDGTLYSLAAHAGNGFRAGFDGVPVLADIDGDGFPEILVHESFGTCISTPWMTSEASPAGAAKISQDMERNGMGRLQIRTASLSPSEESNYYYNYTYTHSLLALRRDGTLARSWKLGGAGHYPAVSGLNVSVGDFDGKGLTQIALVYPRVDGTTEYNTFFRRGVVAVLDTGAPNAASGHDWPLMNHDAQNSSTFRGPETNLAVSILAPARESEASGSTTLTAQASDDGGISKVQFRLDGQDLGTALAEAPYTMTWDASTLALGPHTLAAVAWNQTGWARVSAPVTFYVGRKASSTSLVLDTGSSTVSYGSSLTFRASVNPVPTGGTLTFLDGETALAGKVALVDGGASFTTTALLPGAHSLSTRYSGDDSTLGSASAALAVTVTPVTSSITIGAPSNAFKGSAVTLWAIVEPAWAGGTVTYLDGTQVLAEGVVVENGGAEFITDKLAWGSHTLTVRYSGDALTTSSVSAPKMMTIDRNLSFTNLALSSTFSVLGDAVTLSATIVPPGVGGTVTFQDASQVLAEGVVLTNGVATFTTSSLAVGIHILGASYSGDASTKPSSATSLSATVAQASSSITLVSGSTSPVLGDAVLLTATVVPSWAGGTVTFLDGTQVLAEGVALANGVATFSTAPLALGSHALMARYSGEARATGSVSASLPMTVVPVSSSIVLAADSASPVLGDSLTLTATVVPAWAAGTVTFLDGTRVLAGGVALANGVATFSASGLGAGRHALAARYDTGDARTTGAASPILNLAMTDFSIAAQTSGATVNAGGSAWFNLALTPLDGFTGTVTFTCSGLPSGFQAAFSPATLTLGEGPATTTLTVTSAVTTAASRRPFAPGKPWLGLPAGGILGLVWIGKGGRRSRRASWILACMVLAALGLFTRCGGSGGGSGGQASQPSSPSQAYTVTVTARCGNDQHAVQATLTVVP